MYEAKILADSICNGHRLTTMQLTHPRIVHAEFNTHCMFARNASSSRAIPFKKMVQRVIDDPYIPRTFGINEKGMQAFSYLQGEDYEDAKSLWLEARDEMITYSRALSETLNVHKQIVNRLLEPWMWITVCVTGDAGAWSNYFALRCHPDAAEAIADQAYMAQLAYFKSEPVNLRIGQWHLPYITPDDRLDVPHDGQIEVSIGRCARTSYLTQEGKRDFQEDIKLFERLSSSVPMHASPFEHVCEAMGNDERYSKYIGWRSYRHLLPREYVTDFKPNHPELI